MNTHAPQKDNSYLVCPLTTHEKTIQAHCIMWKSKFHRCDNCPLKLNYKVDRSEPSYSAIKQGF